MFTPHGRPFPLGGGGGGGLEEEVKGPERGMGGRAVLGMATNYIWISGINLNVSP